MLRHSLLIIYRNFRRFKSTFLINLIGLSTGLACALLIYLWVSDELSVDRFHEKNDQLYKVMMKTENPEFGIQVIGHPPGPLAQALAEEMPEVEFATPVIPAWSEGIIATESKHIRASAYFAGKDFFSVFSYPILEGAKESALKDKNSILISDELALKLFNSKQNVTGKSVRWDNDDFNGTYFISGVFKKPPVNSSAQFDVLFPTQIIFDGNRNLTTWNNGGAQAYLVLKKGTDPEFFNKKLHDYLRNKGSDKYWSIFIIPYADHYLYGKYENGVQAGGKIEYVRLFSLIGIFILLIACVNFMNLSTAKASARIKEIGIKKAIGAGRKSLIAQYLGESLFMSFLSLGIAILLVDILLHPFNTITGKQLMLSFNPEITITAFLITVFTGIASGAYPALYLSGFKPAIVLKGKLTLSTGESWMRKALVIFQFIISAILILSVMVVHKQIAYIQSKNLGYEKENVILFKKEGKLDFTMDAFLQELKSLPGVINASALQGNLTSGGNKTAGLIWEGKKPDDLTVFGQVNINYDLIETLKIEMKEGRSFSRTFGSDTGKVILNEAAIEHMALKEPLGAIIKYGRTDLQIVGITKNFHFESLYKPLIPSFMVLREGNNVVARIAATNQRETIENIQKVYNKYNPGLAFDYKFMDESYQQYYIAEQRISLLSRYFAGIAVVISCLGLFGLASFTAQKRSKEIGIRKVLGSGVVRIVYLLTSDFTKVVLKAILVALPLSYFLITLWLSNFVYRIELDILFFIYTGFIALGTAWISVGMQAWKAARVNPVNCLKDE
jgi:putative ABC transport system permease protein